MADALGSEVQLESAGGAYGIYAYGPLGSEATAESGAPTVVAATPYAATGSEVGVEDGAAAVTTVAPATSTGGGGRWYVAPFVPRQPDLMVMATGAEVGVRAGWLEVATADPWGFDEEAALAAVMEML